MLKYVNNEIFHTFFFSGGGITPSWSTLFFNKLAERYCADAANCVTINFVSML
jgi:hypothetical protein